MVLNTAITSKPVPIATSTTLPANVYEVSTDPSVYHMTFSQSIWRPNNDNTVYNVHIHDDMEDEHGPAVGGRMQVANSVMEMCGFLNIPNGWRATKIFVDVHADTTSSPSFGRISNGIYIHEVKTWTTAATLISATHGPKTLGTGTPHTTTNTLYELDETMVGAIDNAMWILIDTTETSQMVAGGYIVIEEV